jgi:hypothetical protein
VHGASSLRMLVNIHRTFTNHPDAARVPTHTMLFFMKKFPVIDCERDSIQEYYPRCME